MTDDRRNRIGGSDVAAILGLSKWKSPVELYLEKTGEAAPDDGQKPWLEWGTKIEPLLLDKVADEIGEPIERKVRVQHPTLDWFCGEADGLTPSRIIEAKIDRYGFQWGVAGTDDVPDYYAVQVQAYMMMTGRELAEFATLVGGSDFRRYTVAASMTVQQWIEEEVIEFWLRVKMRDPPNPRTEEDCKALWRRSNGVTVTASTLAQETHAELVALRAQAKDIEARTEAARAILMMELGESDTLVSPGGVVLATWRTGKAVQRFDAKALQAADPETYNRFIKTGEPTRPLLIKEPKP
jgi:putative phage-type endonuclease